MAQLDKVEKQPADTQDYDADYSAYLDDLGDTGATATVVAATGITVDSHSVITSTAKHAVAGVVGGVVKVWFSGGTSGTTYKVTVALTTTGGRIREFDFNVSVKDL